MNQQFWAGLALNALLNMFFVGAAWGHLKAGQKRAADDLTSIRKSLGLENGDPGAFVRRQEWEISERSSQHQISRLEDELSALRNRLDP